MRTPCRSKQRAEPWLPEKHGGRSQFLCVSRTKRKEFNLRPQLDHGHENQAKWVYSGEQEDSSDRPKGHDLLIGPSPGSYTRSNSWGFPSLPRMMKANSPPRGVRQAMCTSCRTRNRRAPVRPTRHGQRRHRARGIENWHGGTEGGGFCMLLH